MTPPSAPRVSFIVLSYNYEDLIGVTLRSILDQTFEDFEIVVVDDASSDASREVVRGFSDPRIRLLVNEQNLGGAGSYNRAVEAARGEFLVNLDADDWIAPRKTELQIEHMLLNPALDVLGTHVQIVDIEGRRHRLAAELEPLVNGAWDLNRIDSWVMHNPLCRSSTMVRRSSHLRIGLDDTSMVRAPDYELWTRALRMGCRFDVIPEPLTYYRMQARGVTHADPFGTFLELAYCVLRNLLPAIEARAAYPTLARAMSWIARHDQLAELGPRERYRLIGFLLRSVEFDSFAAFKSALRDGHGDDRELVAEGRRGFALLALNPDRFRVDRLQSDVEAYIGARDYWHCQSDAWETEARKLAGLQGLARTAHVWRRRVKRWSGK